MAYTKQNFADGQVLYASQLNKIEQGIVDNEKLATDKQDKLVSGSNIKTIGGESILGSGDINVKPNSLGFGMNGKVVSILGDSISTFKGYIPIADGFNLEHPYTYPSRDVTSVNDTWWMTVINKLEAKLGINDSWSGSRVQNTSTADDGGGNTGAKVCMPSITRITNLGSNGTPDLIFWYGGTNDGKFSTLGTFDASQVYNSVDLEAVTWSSFAEAYKAGIMRIQYFYPNARLVCMTPMFVSSWYDHAVLDKYADMIVEVCNYFGVPCIDLRKCGISYANISTYLGDGLHPNKAGMQLVSYYVLSQLKSILMEDEEENIVYKITNDLGSITTDKMHIVGVSAGKPYSATLSSSANVRVYMGGTDITASALSGTTITINTVTGDVVVSVNGAPPSTTVPVTAISQANGISSYSLNIGGTTQLNVFYTPSNTTQTGVDFTSSNSSVASVTTGGFVTANTSGSATITATSKHNSGLKTSWDITVSESSSGGGNDGGGAGEPTDVTWYVDFTDIKPNYNYGLQQQPGFALRNSATKAAITGVPINAIKAIVVNSGQLSVGRGNASGEGATTLCSIKVVGSGNLNDSTPQTILLPSTYTLNEGEFFIIGRGAGIAAADSASLGVATSGGRDAAQVRTGWRDSGTGTKDENWSAPVAVGYAK